MKKRKEKRKYVARPGFEPRTPDLRVRCPTDCATRPGRAEVKYVWRPHNDKRVSLNVFYTRGVPKACKSRNFLVTTIKTERLKAKTHKAIISLDISAERFFFSEDIFATSLKELYPKDTAVFYFRMPGVINEQFLFFFYLCYI